MSADSRYWANKLDKIQFALDILMQVRAGRNLDRLIHHLQEQEDLATKDLIEAEQYDDKIQ